ncbi:NAD-binding Rossmann fold oxidoreductase [Penicillium atrosanguineum]|uniref:NAD-binding Rossmann fold oxidoreductase n=1 Tax=Penicillium atrosanguineum TaxID=1132637 RepID=A0A9W9Q3D6_9EURO|nr:Armadillo-like helical [Penicillium atrosanguineum]KAJ5149044.1 NAD-binding Rossmann fold oxidoreductase [Penicillium atrosanguineum]KAJ5304358.1 Armadillo-like helical [Penicillium atrosanguineum]KAJ5323830.1 NAD-binding Rossmann fold oxidoreductase [Penicillium atrosanguineum]
MTGIALLGAGLFAKEAHLPALMKLQANLLAVYSRSARSAQSVLAVADELGAATSNIGVYADELESEGNGLAALLQRSEIGAVIVALPILVQPDVVRKCLAAGKHVLCEKPVAKDTNAALELVKDYERDYLPQGLVLSVAEQFRYDRAFTRARGLVTDGRIGKLNHVHARVWGNIQPGDNKWYETEWRKTPEYQGGFILDGGVHFVALIRYVSGREITKTVSLCRQTYPHLPPVDTVNAAIQFDDGASGSLSFCFASAKGKFEFIFVGEQGALTISGVDGKDDTQRIVLESLEGKVTVDEEIVGEGIYEEVKAFLGSCAGGTHDEKAGAREAMADIAVVESICSGGGSVEVFRQ